MIRDLQIEKRYRPHSPPSEVEGIRIVVISFQNIAKKPIVAGSLQLPRILQNFLEVSFKICIELLRNFPKYQLLLNLLKIRGNFSRNVAEICTQI